MLKQFFDTEKVKAALLQFTKEGFAKYIASKPEIRDIYTFAYDFDTLYNKVHLSLNTLEAHNETIEYYKTLSYMQESISTPEGILSIKYQPGNYKHCAFDTFYPLTDKEIAAVNAINIDDDTTDDYKACSNYHSSMRELCSEVMALYATSNTIKLLPITSAVYFIATDLNENYLEAEERIKKYL